MTNITDIPIETLLHIFSFYLETETQRNFVNNVCRVCRSWKQIALDSSLWKTFDGTLPFSMFVRLCKKGSLVNAQDIKFSKEDATSAKNMNLSEIYSNLPSARKIDFSKVKLQKHFISNLEDKCPDLCEISVSDAKKPYAITIPSQIFDHFFILRGTKITHLDFSYSHITSLQKLFLSIAKTCPNLKDLLVLSLDPSSSLPVFPIENMQEGCSKLKTLRLGWPIKYNSRGKKSCVGFPELEVFTHSGMQDYQFTDEKLVRLLFLSNKLKVLDIRGCIFLTADGVNSLTASDLERLYISRSKINLSIDSKKLYQKWHHSLIELDISRNDREDINDLLYSVIPFNGMPKLESLTVSFTKLNGFLVKLIIENCTKLSYLQLEGCRRIGRGLMRSYHGRQALEDLLLKLDKIEPTCDGD